MGAWNRKGWSKEKIAEAIIASPDKRYRGGSGGERDSDPVMY